MSYPPRRDTTSWTHFVPGLWRFVIAMSGYCFRGLRLSSAGRGIEGGAPTKDDQGGRRDRPPCLSETPEPIPANHNIGDSHPQYGRPRGAAPTKSHPHPWILTTHFPAIAVLPRIGRSAIVRAARENDFLRMGRHWTEREGRLSHGIGDSGEREDVDNALGQLR